MKSCTSYEPENMALMSVCTAGLEASAAMNDDIFALRRWYTTSLIPQDSACSSSGPNNDDSSEDGGSGANALPPALSTSSVSSSSSSLSEGLASSVAVPFQGACRSRPFSRLWRSLAALRPAAPACVVLQQFSSTVQHERLCGSVNKQRGLRQ